MVSCRTPRLAYARVLFRHAEVVKIVFNLLPITSNGSQYRDDDTGSHNQIFAMSSVARI